MSRFESLRARILHPARVCLSLQFFASLLLLAACDPHWYNRGAPPTTTAAPTPATVTSIPETMTPAAPTQTPTEAPSAPLMVQTELPGPTQTPVVTPTDQAPTSTATLSVPSGRAVNGTGNSTIEQAHLRLQGQGDPAFLIIVSSQSAGVEGEIYRDLRQRRFRTTTGPDEGIDTSGEFCYPYCVYVVSEEVNANGIDVWVRVLQHEYRHITQAKNNPSMAEDFRDANGVFTSYGAFLEACADYGLNVALVYRAQQRIDQLKNVLGTDQQALIDLGCTGDKSSYQFLLDQYNQKVGQSTAFQELFPPYR